MVKGDTSRLDKYRARHEGQFIEMADDWDGWSSTHDDDAEDDEEELLGFRPDSSSEAQHVLEVDERFSPWCIFVVAPLVSLYVAYVVWSLLAVFSNMSLKPDVIACGGNDMWWVVVTAATIAVVGMGFKLSSIQAAHTVAVFLASGSIAVLMQCNTKSEAALSFVNVVVAICVLVWALDHYSKLNQNCVIEVQWN